MNIEKFVNPRAGGAGLFFLLALPALICGQGSTPPSTQIPPKTSPAAQANKQPAPMDIFAGLQYTEDQKAQIGRIHQDIQLRRNTVIKDDKLSSDQKGAFLEGFDRLERREVFKVLTREQQIEVRKRMSTLRQGAQMDTEKKKLPPKE